MKPRAFIGSSVEGLSIAYAIQQNLLRDVEITVWDQGVFELSSTTVESLTKALASNDFGIFVFSPDDIVKMRGTESPSVRDNVLFELGLFIGKLGRDRVFFLLPSGSNIHIPSDLLGVTPARYETNRTDGSMQAATGPACHQIREQIGKLGPSESRNPSPSIPEDSSKPIPEKNQWILEFVDKRYDLAKATLQRLLEGQADNTALETQAWILYCDYKLDDSIGLEPLLEFAKSRPASSAAQTIIANILRLEHHTDKAVNLIREAKKALPDDQSLDIMLSKLHLANRDPHMAISVLEDASPGSSPDVALALSEVLEEQENLPEALKVIQACYTENPTHQNLRYKYARLAQDLEMHSVALYLLDELTKENAESIEYWGYLGNCCLSLDLNDQALVAYRRAETLMTEDDSDQWIVSNIGNILNNLGLPSEARIYLDRAISKDPGSEYAHDRLAGSLKSAAEELKIYKKKCTDGFLKIREFSATIKE